MAAVEGVRRHPEVGTPPGDLARRIVGQSPALLDALDVLTRVAPTPATVLLLGESGTGKDLLAQVLHEASARATRPFVKLHCGALAENLLESELFGHERGSFTGATQRREGRFELADGGTLFLDEIGDVSPAMQVKLLRVLQNREFERVGGMRTLQVDVRLVAATNKDLQGAVGKGQFREDLFYRLNVVTLTVPPLRHRGGDVQLLAESFLSRYALAYRKDLQGFTDPALQALLAHPWPGNVRELENAIECAVAVGRGSRVRLEDLPASVRHARSSQGVQVPGASLREIERDAILRTLASVGGSTTKAARILAVSPRRIQYRLKEMAEERRKGIGSLDGLNDGKTH